MNIETCFSPALFPVYKNTEAVVVVVDILRATTSICSAFENGVQSIIPVASSKDLPDYKAQGYLVAAERNGLKLDVADFGNSPEGFQTEQVKGKTIVYSTTNGTKTIQMAADCKAVVIASFSNLSAVARYVVQQQSPVTLLCAGWKGKYNIEDTVFCGALAEKLVQTQKFTSDCDATKTAVEMWRNHKHDLRTLIEICAQNTRLTTNNLHHCIDFCLTLDTTNKVPVFAGNEITAVEV
ncbi:MAG: 2-phosphosulfolactate phosphatase [Bacteroidales bacterium]|jgi:2-phosphosulfolactate phosphatase|nr:2-phosphosulfolactate phosphatase [Bacteroidales bacterium]